MVRIIVAVLLTAAGLAVASHGQDLGPACAIDAGRCLDAASWDDGGDEHAPAVWFDGAGTGALLVQSEPPRLVWLDDDGFQAGVDPFVGALHLTGHADAGVDQLAPFQGGLVVLGEAPAADGDDVVLWRIDRDGGIGATARLDWARFDDAMVLLVDDEAGTIFVVGHGTNVGRDADLFVTALDGDLRTRWTASWASPAGEQDWATGATLQDGDPVVVGKAGQDGHADPFAWRLDGDSGDTQWLRVLPGERPGAGYDTAGRVIATNDAVVMSAFWQGGPTNGDAGVIALDPNTGATQWRTLYQQQLPAAVDQTRLVGVDLAAHLAYDEVNDRIVAAGWQGTPAGQDMLALGIDAADGTLAWTWTYNGGPEHDEVTAVVTLSAGRVALVGTSRGPTGFDDITTHIMDAATGTVQTTYRDRGDVIGDDAPTGIWINGDRLWISGLIRSADTGMDARLLGIDVPAVGSWPAVPTLPVMP